MRKLGVIGGLGPMASARFLGLLTQMSEAKRDQEHMEVLLYSKPQIPDRTAYILGESREDPLPALVGAGRILADWGAERIVIPCVTSGYFREALESRIGTPVVDLAREIALQARSEGVGRLGILATSGTIRSGLLQKELSGQGVEALTPEGEEQERVMRVIYGQLKAGEEADPELLAPAARTLREKGAQAVLLGCTELSLIGRASLPGADEGLPFLDAMEVLARKAVAECGRLKAEYRTLL
ncbi:MAG: amino acid racemase [Eubacteriales bacterium]|nr:amino acid racemase [Eubacteriales bacterium]